MSPVEVRGKMDSTSCCGVNLACASGFVWGRWCFLLVAKAWRFAFFAPLRSFWFGWKSGVFGRWSVPWFGTRATEYMETLRAASYLMARLNSLRKKSRNEEDPSLSGSSRTDLAGFMA